MAFKTLKGKVAERATPGAVQLLNGEDVERNKAKPQRKQSLFLLEFLSSPQCFFFLSLTAKE